MVFIENMFGTQISEKHTFIKKKRLHVEFIVVFFAIVKNGKLPGFTSVGDWINYDMYQWVEYISKTERSL